MRFVTVLALAALVAAIPVEPNTPGSVTPTTAPQQGGWMKTVGDDINWAHQRVHDDVVWAGQRIGEGVAAVRAYYYAHLPWLQEKFTEGVKFSKDESAKIIAWGKTTAGQDIAWIRQKEGEWQAVAEADVKATIAKGQQLAASAKHSFDAHFPWLSAKIQGGVKFATDESTKAIAWAKTTAGPYVAWVKQKGGEWEVVAEAKVKAAVEEGKKLAASAKANIEADIPWLKKKFQEDVKIVTDETNKAIAWGKTTAGKDLAWIKEKEGQWKKVAQADLQATIAKAKEISARTQAGAQSWFAWAKSGVQSWWNGPQATPTPAH